MPKSANEQKLYAPVQQSLKRLFSKLGSNHLEITASKKFSPELREKCDDVSLHIMDQEAFYPDIMGFVTSLNAYPPVQLIVCDIKDTELKLKDIAQVREYGAVFSAQHAILISSKPIPERIKRWYPDKRPTLGTFYQSENVRIAQWGFIPYGNLLSKYHAELNKELGIVTHRDDYPAQAILGWTWIPSPPFAPQCQTCQQATLWNKVLKQFQCASCKTPYDMASV